MVAGRRTRCSFASENQALEAVVFDLEVRYIGRARGRIAETCALDRLEAHSAYQSVLEEVLTSQRNRDVWLVLGSGTTLWASTAGKAEPDYDKEEWLVNRARSILSKNRRIDIAEAIAINYFKPFYNEQHVGELDLSSKTFRHAYEAGLTGLTVIETAGQNWGIALYTDTVKGKADHVMTVCLY